MLFISQFGWKKIHQLIKVTDSPRAQNHIQNVCIVWALTVASKHKLQQWQTHFFKSSLLAKIMFFVKWSFTVRGIWLTDICNLNISPWSPHKCFITAAFRETMSKSDKCFESMFLPPFKHKNHWRNRYSGLLFCEFKTVWMYNDNQNTLWTRSFLKPYVYDMKYHFIWEKK